MVNMSFTPQGIGDLIRDRRLSVPPNQRSYAWEAQNVRELLEDVNGEMSKPRSKGLPEYFLGTIVLVNGVHGTPPHISDGQQRIATTSIIFARVRDILNELGRGAQVLAVEREYIKKTDYKISEDLSQLSMNVEDNAFYSSVILSPYPHKSDAIATRSSNQRLLKASEVIYAYFQNDIKGYNGDLRADRLVQWIEFLKEKTFVVVVRVPDENNAFRIFETLNDRGVKAGQVDILKNFFLQNSTNRLAETHLQWTELGEETRSFFE